MNQLKTNYVLNRIKQIERAKLNAVEKKKTKAEIKLSPRQRFELLKSGKVKFCSDACKLERYDYVTSIFDFSPFEHDEEYDQKAFEKEQDAIRKSADTLRDEVVLGDEEKAMKLLKKFEQM